MHNPSSDKHGRGGLDAPSRPLSSSLARVVLKATASIALGVMMVVSRRSWQALSLSHVVVGSEQFEALDGRSISSSVAVAGGVSTSTAPTINSPNEAAGDYFELARTEEERGRASNINRRERSDQDRQLGRGDGRGDAATTPTSRLETRESTIRRRNLQSGGNGLEVSSRKATPTVVLSTEKGGGGGGGGAGSSEAYSIKPRKIPFRQQKGEWQKAGHGISLNARGEPKSGTTWLGRLIPQLALELCGSFNNPWCEMGGLAVHPNEPSPWYEFEMLKKEGGTAGGPKLFLHYKGDGKHVIPGMANQNDRDGCHNGGRRHRNFFEDDPPCKADGPPTRARLRACLWDTSPRCRKYLPSTDAAVRRTAVIVRDPRNVIMSERRMRLEYYKQIWVADISMDDFVRQRFETLVSWMHQRWVWHTHTVMSSSSHVMFYEDLQEAHVGMIDLSAFMGLECSPEQAERVWASHQSTSAPDDYTTLGLQTETLELMNATMARLLPVPMVERWGLTPTDL